MKKEYKTIDMRVLGVEEVIATSGSGSAQVVKIGGVLGGAGSGEIIAGAPENSGVPQFEN